jgi:hypothetical protein
MGELAVCPNLERQVNRKLDMLFIHSLGDNDVDAWQQKDKLTTF